MKKGVILLAFLALTLGWSGAFAADCVDVELGAEVVAGDPFNTLSVYFYALNCSMDPGVVTFTISLEKDATPLGEGSVDAFMPADKPFVKECDLPIPPGIPAGTYTLCITATLGTASDTACATVTIDALGNVIGFEVLRDPSPTENSSWGKIKTEYQK